MSAQPATAESPASNLKPLNTPKLSLGQAFIKGRIHGRRKISTQDGPLWLTVLKMPARNEYSSPSTVLLRSRSPLGQKDDDWDGIVEIGGFGRSFDAKPDKETGEITRVQTAENTLTVVEA